MINPSKQISSFFSALLLTFGLITGQTVFAEDTESPGQHTLTANDSEPDQSRQLELETVMVTAQKQEQDVKDVPITISVFNTIDLEDMNVESVKDILVHTPNMSAFAAGGEGLSTPNIRGLNASLRSFGTSTAMYVDGIPFTSGFGFDLILQDIEHIEVLKGPQGTLYGKNAEAGVVNIITRKPGDEVIVKVAGEYGEDNKMTASANVSGPIIRDKLYFGLAAKHYQKDGYITDTTTGDPANDQEYQFGKVNLRLTPTDNLEFSVLWQKIKYDNGNLNMNSMNADNPRKISSDISDEYYDRPISTIAALNATYHYNDVKFETIVTHSRYEQDAFVDFDFTDDPLSMYHLVSKNDFLKLSGELRISSITGPVTWLMGLYTDKDDNNVENTVTMMAGAYTTQITHDLEASNMSVFAHADWAVTDQLSLIGGIRYDWDEKEFTQKSTGDHDEGDYFTASPKLSTRYLLSPEASVFATVSKGYRAGGFNSFAPAYSGSTEYLNYDKETVWNYEVGAKTSFLENRLNLDLSVFYMKIDDMQVETAVDNIFTYVLNAAEATSKGAEISAKFKATNEISLFGSFGYTDITFDKFSDNNGDYSGNTNPFSPEHNYSFGTQWRFMDGWFARAEVNGYGKMYLDKANRYERDPYALVNAKAGYEGGAYDLYLNVKNLLDKEYDSEGYYDGQYVIPSPPREIALSVAYRF